MSKFGLGLRNEGRLFCSINSFEITGGHQMGCLFGEKDFHPILVTKYSIGDNKPLKPNYVKDFGYSIQDYAPSLWRGKVKGKISDIEFAE